MPSIRQLPRSRQFSERAINRKYKQFKYGMVRQADVEGMNVPNGAVADACDMLCREDCMETRPGSRLLTPADFGVTIADNTESLSTFVQTGQAYTANGSVIPSIDDVFVVYGTGDTTGNNLEAAKGSAPRKYDCFRIDEISVGSEAISYLGRIGIAAEPGYGDTPSTEYTATLTLISGVYTITATAGPDFNTAHVGYYFNWNNGTRSRIIRWITATTLETDDTTTRTSTTMCYVQPPVNATLHHKGADALVALFGDKVYISKGIPFAGWTRIYGLYALAPLNSYESSMVEDGDDAILFNPYGPFRIKLSEQPYYFYQLNADQPTVKITNVSRDGADKYKYNYTYTISRLTGGTIDQDRSNGSAGVVLEHESAPVLPDTDRKDFGYVWAEEEVGSETDVYGKLTGGTITGTYATPAGYSSTTNAQVTVVVNGTSYNVATDLTAVMTMKDVADRFQWSTRAHPDLALVEWEWDTDHFVISTGEGDTIGYCTAGGGGTDMATNMKLTDGTAASKTDTASCLTPITISLLTRPVNHCHGTHYSAYRTPDAAEDDSPNEHRYSWIADVPMAKCFTGSVTSGTLTISSTDSVALEDEDTNAVVFAEDGSSVTITEVTSAMTATVTGADISAQSMGIGGGTIVTGYQTGTAITISSGPSLDSNLHTGKQIFWADGKQSIIQSVTNTTTAVATKFEAHGSVSSQMAGMVNPVSRTFCDTISDQQIAYGKFSAWPLRNRYWKPLPYGTLGTVAPGYLFCALRSGKKYNYSQIALRWLAGYYNDGGQYSEQIWDGIQAMKVVDNGILIRGKSQTYFVQTTTPTDYGEKAVGESVAKLPDPIVVHRSIGSVGMGGAQDIEPKGEVLVTNEPAVRTFDGNSYSDNWAEKRIQKSDLVKMKPSYIGGYQSVCGYFLWGKQEI